MSTDYKEEKDNRLEYFEHVSDIDAELIEFGVNGGSINYVVKHEDLEDVSGKTKDLLEGDSDPFNYRLNELADINEELQRVSAGSLDEDQSLKEFKDENFSRYEGQMNYSSFMMRDDTTVIEVGIGEEDFRYEINRDELSNIEDETLRNVVRGQENLYNMEKKERHEVLKKLEKLSG